MATLTIDTAKIRSNIKKLNKFFDEHNIEWSLVTKMFAGHKPTLERILTDPEIKKVHSVADSRISNLKAIKEVAPDVVTMYIKPPAINQVKNVIQYSDISLNSSYSTIEELDKEAGRQNKIHRIVVMIELGELREGVLRDDILNFYERIFKFKNIQTIGIGTNLGCMYGIEPTYDKLIQLTLFTKLIEAKFDHKLELISGGSSMTLPLITKNSIPKGMNHFRIGEAALLGKSPLNNNRFEDLYTSTFEFSAEVIEVYKKENQPDGVIGEGNVGHTPVIPDDAEIKETHRCIVDFGQIDVDPVNLLIKDKGVIFAGITSDMTVFDLGEENSKYKVGSQLNFIPNYTAAASLMNSRYITKNVI